MVVDPDVARNPGRGSIGLRGALAGRANRSQRRGRRALPIAGSILALIAFGHEAQAAPNCMTRMIADVAAEEAPEQVKSKSNGDFGPVTQIRVNKQTGRMVYCAKNSYCYWSNAFEFITPCRIKRDDSESSRPYFAYFTR